MNNNVCFNISNYNWNKYNLILYHNVWRIYENQKNRFNKYTFTAKYIFTVKIMRNKNVGNDFQLVWFVTVINKSFKVLKRKPNHTHNYDVLEW